MNLTPLSCPNCGAKLEPENELDMFYCDYCGFKILNDDPQRREAIVRLKESENARKIKEIDAEVEKHRITTNLARDRSRNRHVTIRELNKNRNNTIQAIAHTVKSNPTQSIILVWIILATVMIVLTNISAHRSSVERSREQEREEARVQDIYDEVVELMESKEYEEALKTAELIVYDSSLGGDKADEWKLKKRELISQIKEEMGIDPLTVIISEKPSYYKGKNYKDVELMFEEMGFEYISFEKVRENTIGTILYDSGDVIEVSINGTTDFKKGTEFKEDAIILIRYKV